MNILLVAPSRNLRYAGSEIQSVVNLLHPDILLDDGATIDALLDKLGNGYDLFWFAGHSTSEGLELSDGVLSADSLTQFLLSSDTTIFLNSCSSLLVALHINQQLRSTVIATINDVEDISAYQTGALFARMLAKGKGFREAFDESNTSLSQYVFLPGVSKDSDAIEFVRSEIELMRIMIEDLERRRVEQWEKYRAESDERYHPRLDTHSARLWAAGFALFIANVFFFYSDVRELLHMNWMLAVLFALISFPISGALFMQGMKLDPRTGIKRGALIAAIIILTIFAVFI